MPSKNPWRQFSHDIYEKHMGHENVRQLEMLSHIVDDQLELVMHIQKPVVAMLGITSGNGLEHFEQGRYGEIIGIDINEEFLGICRARHSHLLKLSLYQIDLMTEKDRAAKLLQAADLVTANLLVKHIHLCNFVDIVRKLTKPLLSVTIQYNPDGQPVSASGFEREFDGIQQHGQDCDEVDLTASMSDADYRLINRIGYVLPNGKVFIRLDFARKERE